MGMLLAIFGVVLLLFGVVALFAAPAWLAGVHLAAGFGLLGVAMLRGLGQLREVFARDSTRRGARYLGGALLQTGAIGVICGLIAFLSVRHSVRWDWTEAREHSLAAASLDVLTQIPADRSIEILAFFVAGAQDGSREILDRYTYATDRVSVQLHDPIRRPDLAQRHQVRRGGVLIVCGGPCDSARGTARVEQPSEQEITKAIRSVISERRKLYFLTGHGEGDPLSEEVDGFSRARLALQDENIEVDTLLLANREEVPEDADAVLVAGPKLSLLDRELAALDRYLRGGGSLLVMADPIVVSNLEDQVREWGVELGSDIIVDEQIQLFAGPQLGVQPIITDYGSHPITADFVSSAAAAPTLFNMARSVRAAEGAQDDVVELVRTGRSSWAERDVERFTRDGVVAMDPERDRPGPVALGVAREFARDDEDGREGRLVVFGDADFVRNRHFAEFYNGDLFANIASWLVGEDEFITIDRKLPRASTVAMTMDQVSAFRYLAIFVLPELLLLLGLLSWWSRRVPG